MLHAEYPQIRRCEHLSKGNASKHAERTHACRLGGWVRRDPHDLASWVNKIE
jgi:hypothetical protein